MAIKTLLLVLIITSTLAGCKTIDDFYRTRNSVKVGDTYQVMLDKMGGKPFEVNCLQRASGSRCTAIYQAGYATRVYFRFNTEYILTSIYY